MTDSSSCGWLVRYIIAFWLLFLTSKCSRAEISKDNVEIFTLNNFPNQNKIALHFPCSESNVFPTKCMCHIKCADKNCMNARQVCAKYSALGCRYTILRGGKASRFATLKRTPTAEESSDVPRLGGYWVRLDVSGFAGGAGTGTGTEGGRNFSLSSSTSAIQHSGYMVKQLVQGLGRRGWGAVERIFDLGNYNYNNATEAMHRRNLISSPSNHLIEREGKKKTTEVVRQLQQKEHEEQQEQGGHCGKALASLSAGGRGEAKRTFLSSSIALVVLSYHSPRTLLNTLRSYRSGGLLDIVSEKIALLNDPYIEELQIARQFSFSVLQPRDLGPSVLYAEDRDNVVTIGAAFYYAMHFVHSEYVLFMENDFKLDTSYPHMKMDLLVGLLMLEQGTALVRLQSRSYQGCGNFLSCQQANVHHSRGERKRNWYTFYCPGKSPVETHVSDCFAEPAYRCFTSWDTNWSLNAALMKKSTMLNTKYKLKGNESISLPELGLRHHKHQDGLESAMAYSLPWPKWRVPLCISLQGLFIHEEIETGS